LFANDSQETEAEAAYNRAISILDSTVKRWPALDAARKSLIEAHLNRALLMKHLGRGGEEEAAWMQAAEHQTKRAADFADRPDPSAELAKTHFALAGFRMEKPAQAIAALREAYDRQKHAFLLAPQRADLLANLGVYGTALVEALTNTSDFPGAVQAAERLTADLPAQWNGFPKIAGLMSQCLRAAREDRKAPEADRDKLVRQCGMAAMGALRRAAAGGFRDAALLQSMPELAALRESAEFKEEFGKLIAEIGN
jgi:tetratricopeptide (TPR) repeat protein